MRYIVVNKSNAERYGVTAKSHIMIDNSIVMNELEVINNNKLNGSFDDRAEMLGATAIYRSARQLKDFLKIN